MTSSLCHNISDKLIAINYPYSWNDKASSPDDGVNYRNLQDIVIFLEDTIIRSLPIQSRQTLKQTATADKKTFYQSLYDYCDCSNNINIVKLQGGGAFMQSSASSETSSGFGIKKLLNDLKNGESDAVCDLAAIVLVDRLLDLAIAQIVQDKSMNLEAAHAQWQEEQGKRNVATLDLSNSLWKGDKEKNSGSSNSQKKSSSNNDNNSLSKFVAEILACRNTHENGKTTNNKKSDSLAAQIGAASRFSIGLVGYENHNNICEKFASNQSDSSSSSSDRKQTFSTTKLNLDEEWTKISLSEIPLFGEARVTYDSHTHPKKKLDYGNKKVELLQNCARALRAIYTEDFAALQRRVNVSLARLQELTATCATDAKLGRTGR